MGKRKTRRGWIITALVLAATMIAPAAGADPDVSDGVNDPEHELHGGQDLSAPLIALDNMTDGIVSSGPFAKVIKNFEQRGRGERLDAGSTTDVWSLGNYAYTGTFNNPCGGDPEAGVWVWDTSNNNKVSFVGVIESPPGSRSNDVKAASMNSGDILVHSNEACAGGPGGFEIYNVDDPANPEHLAHVQTDDVNELLREGLGFTDFGVHNLWLFTQDGRDYVAAVAESEFGNFQIFDITDPTDPVGPIGFWGAESLALGPHPAPHPTEDYATLTDFGKILDADAYLFSGFGASQNRFLHDITISADGTEAYLSNWDAGLVLLDISDPTDPTAVSVAIDTGASDGEVNSHAAWPSEDGSIVVETEEDFAPFETIFTIDTGDAAGTYPAAEGAITTPIADLPGSEMTGPTVYVGSGCEGSVFVPGPPFDLPMPTATGTDQLALIQRGGCFFSEKIDNAEAAGYAGVVVFNSAAGGDGLITMGGAPTNLPGVFVGRSTGLAIAGVGDAADLVLGDPGEEVTAAVVPNGWGDVRIWDYSDPESPVLASIFNTVCSAHPTDSSCDPAGTYSVHNVVVEKTGNKTKAYISWYWDGMLILDVTDPYDPVETARFFDNTSDFLDSNGGNPHDFWGVYKQTNEPWILGSDRNGGLFIFKEQGSGSGKK